ncbi:hypothetical protein PYW08_012382 [Mythimna loreyi]|uniref:Uncharacterized protein n=1 Tax=Mythimna loreyi TaxID=667449 RepID=A0ACC2Q1W3_9NEOP|nr:hypothetical protein PYW08_012382 [Mythimna loreyi]
MEKMKVCRICLVDSVRMYFVDDKDLQKLYETLTDIPFVTEDRRPMLACFQCFPQLQQCYQLQKKCLETEKLFAQMLNERNPSVYQGQIKDSSVPAVPPEENNSRIETIVVKEELPDVDDVMEPKVEIFEYELQLERLTNSYLDVAGVPARQSESDADLEPGVPFISKTMEEQEESRKKRRASDTTRAAVVKAQNQHIRRKKLEDVSTENHKKNEENTKVIQNTPSGSSKLIAKYQESFITTTPLFNISDALDTNYHKNIKKRNAHTGEKRFRCEVCEMCFNQKRHFANHFRTHTREKPYSCEECKLCFTQKVHLTRHMRTHTGVKPHKCEECQLCFRQKDHLNRHIRTHTGEKPYKCEQCELCFRHKNTLLSHIRTHTGEKPYKCEQCELRFSQKTTLLRHTRTHTGEKPYKCEQCQFSFSLKSTLKKHVLRRHADEKLIKRSKRQSSGEKAKLTTLKV